MKNIITPVLATFLALISFNCMAQKTIKLYPDNFKDQKRSVVPESFDGRCVSNVSVPEMYVFSPSKEKNTGAAVLICPGGGYSREAIIHEGYQVGEWLASEGITGVVLKYRLPEEEKNIPMEDVTQAMRILRENAASMGIHPEKIGISGFSAGGHLASTAGTHLAGIDRPDFMILFYPVISMKEELTHRGSRDNLLGKNVSESDLIAYSNETQVTPHTPPTLLILSDDDTAVNPLNSIGFYEALKKNKVKSAMYIFPIGGHGWGFKTDFAYHETWKELALKWLRDTGVIQPA